MSKIPEALWEPINTAFPANVCLIGVTLPNGYAQVTPKGSAMVWDGDTLAYWDRGSGTTHDHVQNGTKVTVYFRNSALRESGVLPLGGIARFYGTATLHDEGPIREKVWERMVEPEKERDPDKLGRAVLIAVERAEDLRGSALTE
ncbi:hypothetical protein C2W62_10670 [Candidatus Entotheonella serta]|nr:hypothetical protein C2W62_10670 [Candidatus Entotheonella serta]